MMKKYIKIAAFVLTGALLAACGNKQQTEVTTSNNLFSTLLDKSDAEVQARIDSIWTHFFTPGDISKYDADGEKCVYYEVGDSMGIIVDTGSNDVRTEGMSYGMMISLQLDKREVFDKLWRWAKTYMAYPADSPWDGYFCWQCALDGTQIGQSNASDGEIYFVTALFLAAEKWGEPQYAADANEILHKVSSKDGKASGIYNLFDDSTRLVTFVPNEEVHWYSDPSYCLPVFLDLWAEKADAKNDFWREAADKARWLLEASQDSVTGLYPDYCLFDGKPYRRPNFDYNTDRYQYDAIRCPMNVGMDYYLTGKDASKREQSDARIDSAEREQATPRVWQEPMPWVPLRWPTATMKRIAPWPASMCNGSGMSSRPRANGATMWVWSISSPCSMSLDILIYEEAIGTIGRMLDDGSCLGTKPHNKS